MPAPRRALLALSLLVAATACKSSSDPVQDVCELILSCECSMPPYADVDACAIRVNSDLDDVKAKAAALGLTYDAGCIDPSLALFEDIGCDLPSEVDFSGACVACALVHGDKPAGAACTVYDGGYTDCARDLACIDSACADPCARLGEGTACASDTGGGFASLGVCADGLYCDTAATLTCVTKAFEGSDCTSFDGCKEDLYCNGDMRCAAIPKEGEACDFLCARGFLCDAGVCTVGPALNEPCKDGQCGPALQCDGVTCRAEEPALCMYGLDDDV